MVLIMNSWHWRYKKKAQGGFYYLDSSNPEDVDMGDVVRVGQVVMEEKRCVFCTTCNSMILSCPIKTNDANLKKRIGKLQLHKRHKLVIENKFLFKDNEFSLREGDYFVMKNRDISPGCFLFAGCSAKNKSSRVEMVLDKTTASVVVMVNTPGRVDVCAAIGGKQQLVFNREGDGNKCIIHRWVNRALQVTEERM